jgi:hypothetical protein
MSWISNCGKFHFSDDKRRSQPVVVFRTNHRPLLPNPSHTTVNKRPLHLPVLLAILCLAPLLAAEPPSGDAGGAEPRRLVLYEDFSDPLPAGEFPSDPEAGMNFWTDDGVRQLRHAAERKQARSDNQDAASWRNELGFLYRDLRQSGELGPGQFLSRPYLKFTPTMIWGTDTNSKLGYAVQVLDDEGNGYMGELRRNGEILLYRLDAGVPTLLRHETDGVEGRGRSIVFVVEDGTVSLSETSGHGRVSVDDDTYSAFTRVGFGGRVWEEVLVLDGIEVYGRVTGPDAPGDAPIAHRTSSEIKDSIFGTGVKFPNWADHREMLPLIEETGLKWLRGRVAWYQVEKEKGALEIPPADREWIEAANKRGFKIASVLAYRNQFYPMEDFDTFIEGFARYCAFVVGELQDKVDAWEIWNEPSNFYMRAAYGGSWNAKEGAETPWLQRYADLIVASARAIRAVDPDAVILAGDVNYPVNFRLLDLLAERGAVDLLDGLVLHVYAFRVPPEVQPWGGPLMDERDGVVVVDDDHSYASMFRRIRAKMREVGMENADLYITETGFTSVPNDENNGDRMQVGLSLDAQAKYLARTFLLNKAYGAKVSIQYDFFDHANVFAMDHQERGFGLVRGKERDYAKKPAWYAVRNVCSLFSHPVEAWTPDWKVTVDPPGYPPTRKYPYHASYTVWNGEEIRAPDRVMHFTFRDADNGEVLVALWNAVAPSERGPLLADVTLGTDAFDAFDAVDILTGERIDLLVRRANGKTVFRHLAIPDHPIVLRLRRR